MTPIQYCKQKVAQRDTDLYYGLYSLTHEKRFAVTAIHAYYAAISEIPKRCREESVASRKLQWWREEIELTFAKQLPRHPITQALLSSIKQFQLPKQLFLGIIDGVANYLATPRLTTFQDLILHCHHTTSLREMLVTYVVGKISKESLNFSRDLGCVLRVIEIINHLRLDITKGWLYLPQEDLLRFFVKEEDLLHFKDSVELGKLLHELANKIRLLYMQAVKTLPVEAKNQHLCQLIQAEIALKLLQLMERDKFAILQKRYTLSSIKKILVALRI
jgi:phytoene synthase